MPNVQKCQMMYKRLVMRFMYENPSLVITDRVSGWIYQSICSIYENYGEAEAERYVREAKML